MDAAALHWFPLLSEGKVQILKELWSLALPAPPVSPSFHTPFSLSAPILWWGALPWAPWRGTQLWPQNLFLSGHMFSNHLCPGYPTHPSAPAHRSLVSSGKTSNPTLWLDQIPNIFSPLDLTTVGHYILICSFDSLPLNIWVMKKTEDMFITPYCLLSIYYSAWYETINKCLSVSV